jgi:hypothetical protein
MKLSNDASRAPISVKVALPESARALEQAWQGRRRELARWQHSGGWLVERAAMRRSTGAR